MDAWMKWVKENEASMVDHGAPLGKTRGDFGYQK